MLIGTILVLVVMQGGSPKKINWEDSFSKYHKMPFGNKILFEELGSIFTDTIETSTVEVTRTLADNRLTNYNYLFINRYFYPEGEDLHELLQFVEVGNSVFIAARDFDQRLLDTLGLVVNQEIAVSLIDTNVMWLNTPDGERTKFKLGRGWAHQYFEYTDETIEVLGTTTDSNANCIVIRFNDGNIYLNLEPHAFTNFNMLYEGNHRYVSSVLSNMPDQPVIWDEYYKMREVQAEVSPIYVILSSDGLREAVLLLLAALLLYMAFAVKRRQRAIPLVKTPANATLEFTQTIGQLYFNTRDNSDIALKRTDYFLRNIRAKYGLPTNELNAGFAEKLAALTGVPETDIAELCSFMKWMQTKPAVTDSTLLKLDKMMDDFYDKS